MARLYYLSSVASDLTGGADFSLALNYNNVGTATTQSVTVATSATDISYGFTPALHPDIYGATSDYTITVDVTTANNNMQLAIVLNRINSSGTVQNSSTASAEQALNTTGIKTYTFTALGLGTWASGDRLRINYQFRNTSNMQTSTVAIGVNEPDTYILANSWQTREFTLT